MTQRQDLKQALELARSMSYSPEAGWSTTVLAHGDSVVVFPAGDSVGESPALIEGGTATLMGSVAEHWPDWYWDVCEDESKYVTVE